MAATAKLPKGLVLAASKMGWPVMAAAFGEPGILVASSRYENATALALYDKNLVLQREHMLAKGEQAKFQVRRVVALPDGRFLLCSIWGPSCFVDRNLETAPATLRGTPADDDEFHNADETVARDLFFVGTQAIIGHTSFYSDIYDFERLCVLPPSLAGTPKPWVKSLADAARAKKVFTTRFYMTRGTAFASGLLGATTNKQGSGSSSHSLCWFDAKGTLVKVKMDPAKRAIDKKLEIVADDRRGVAYIATSKNIEAIDAKLASVGKGPLARHALLAGKDGSLLWYDARGKSLTLTGPEDVHPKKLGALGL